MNIRRGGVTVATAIGLACAAPGAWAMMIPERGAVVAADANAGAVVNAVISSIDVARGVLVAGGRTYRFDPAAVGFSDDRVPPVAGGLASLRNGSRVTLRTAMQGGLPQVLQIIAR